jgi:hypothetical protein
MRSLFSFITLFFLLICTALHAQEAGPSQKGHHLFDPTPKDEMREFSIDRPDVTESPITVDAGHFQLEADLVKWTLDNRGKGPTTVSFMNGLYKMGLSHSWDLHVGVELYNLYQDSEGKTVEKGYGNTTIRLKHNFWGNDGGSKTALGMIPYITFTKDNETIYGVGLPFSYGLSDKLDLGAQAQFDFLPAGEEREVSYFQTIVLGGALIGPLDFYVEGVATFYQQEKFYSANGGLIYNVSDNVKIDIATNIGMNDGTPTRAYAGLSFRI